MQFVLILMFYQLEEEKIHCSRILRVLLYSILIGTVVAIDGVFSLPGLPFLPCYHAWKMQKCHSKTIASVLLCFDSFSISAQEFLHVPCKHRHLSLHFALIS